MAGLGPVAELSFEIAYHEDDVIVRVAGELDAFTGPRLGHFLEGLVDEGASRLMLNLSGVSFADSRGLSPLIATAARLRNRGGGLRVCGVGPSISRLAGLMGMADLLPPHSHTGAA